MFNDDTIYYHFFFQYPDLGWIQKDDVVNQLLSFCVCLYLALTCAY